jgi:hypothetical protein
VFRQEIFLLLSAVVVQVVLVALHLLVVVVDPIARSQALSRQMVAVVEVAISTLVLQLVDLVVVQEILQRLLISQVQMELQDKVIKVEMSLPHQLMVDMQQVVAVQEPRVETQSHQAL